MQRNDWNVLNPFLNGFQPPNPPCGKVGGFHVTLGRLGIPRKKRRDGDSNPWYGFDSVQRFGKPFS